MNELGGGQTGPYETKLLDIQFYFKGGGDVIELLTLFLTPKFVCPDLFMWLS